MEAKIESKTLMITIGAVFSIEVGAGMVSSAIRYDPIIILGAARSFQIWLMIQLVSFVGNGPSSIGLAPSRMIDGLKKGFIWSISFGMFIGFACLLIRAIGLNPLSLVEPNLPTGHVKMALFFAVGGVVGPVAEEIFFRGILYGFFRKWGIPLALMVSTLLFVLMHPVSQGLPIPQIFGGFLFAIAYEVEGSLLTPITIHILGNMAIFTISILFRHVS
ncbi:MAG TPA: CPBP family intramembrane metalloprotease [Desulfobacterales bacterium]|nr:CPBP family intramembrane metalloprotease [Desulfobacterales bacterium]